eukprot:TRINITY_DN13620_c0_g1_i1.p1 TRINITY_DN13620_c0_g1~~TRINITY_DN13620_c0_g1_i1.p1  ORF type:complete len:433 (-),score=118.76 TRINITY_DN13620_c0_g1_i1:282-1475(-)
MLRSLVGSEMCIRDRYQRRVRGALTLAMGKIVNFSAILVLLLALFITSLFHPSTNLLKRSGFLGWADKLHGSRGMYFMGMSPALHDGTPWGFTEADMPDLTGQTLLVTGGNVGLGYWTAYHMAKAKGSVTIACRSQAKCDKAATEITAATGTKVNTAVMDLSSFASIRAFAAGFQPDQLDSLVLNAGVMVPPFSLTEDGLEMQIGTNHFGHFLLTDLLLPKVRAAAATGTPTVTVVSSAAHYSSYPEGIRPTIEAMNDEQSYDRKLAYGQSKLANVLFAQELSARLQKDGVLVNSIHPGAVDTDLPRHVVSAMQPWLGEWLTEKIRDFVATEMLWRPRDASLTQVYAAVSAEVKQKKLTGKYFHPIARVNHASDPHTFNTTLQSMLWEMSADFIASH